MLVLGWVTAWGTHGSGVEVQGFKLYPKGHIGQAPSGMLSPAVCNPYKHMLYST